MAKAELYIKNGSSWVNYNLLNAYPVGAIYASASSTSPASLFGGSWAQITDAALRGATWVGYTGSDTHALSVNEMPAHGHANSVPGWAALYINGQGSTRYGSVLSGSWSTTSSAGGGAAHTNVQRSYNCYMWQRTS